MLIKGFTEGVVSAIACCQLIYHLNKQKHHPTGGPETREADPGQNEVIDAQPSSVAGPTMTPGIPGNAGGNAATRGTL